MMMHGRKGALGAQVMPLTATQEQRMASCGVGPVARAGAAGRFALESKVLQFSGWLCVSLDRRQRRGYLQVLVRWHFTR